MSVTTQSFVFGITLAISVGPIAMLIINRSINCGLLTGVVTGTAAAFADLTYGVISFAAGSLIYALLAEHEFWLRTGASAVLILFGGWMLWGATRNRNRHISYSNSTCKGVFASTYALTIANPLTIVAFSGFAAQHATKELSLVIVSSITLFAGSLVVQLALAYFGSTLRRHISNPSVIFYLNMLSGLSIIGMGLAKVL